MNRICLKALLFLCAAAVLSSVSSKVIVVPSEGVKNIAAAMSVARQGDTVKVMEGRYRESVFISPGVTLLSNSLFGTVLDGRGKGTIVNMGTGSVISGFEVRNGTIGILSSSAQTTVKQCRITGNLQSGIMCVGALPNIEDNVIVYNKGSGIQGWDVRTTSGSVNHNTIAFNGNHGIALGGTSSITVENNIIAFNGQFGVKPGDETVRIELINNNFYQNTKFTSSLPSDNISADPLFADAKRHNYNLQKESPCVGLGRDNQNLGVRILH